MNRTIGLGLLPVAPLLLVGAAAARMPAVQDGEAPDTEVHEGPYDAQAAYEGLTNNVVEVVNFNPEPFSGLAVGAGGAVWAVHTHANTVVRSPELGAPVDLLVPTGLNPVSVALWTPPADGGETRATQLLVACTGTHALFVHDAEDGELLDVVRLDSEPADLVVDPEHGVAYVSCQGSNTVLRIDLATRETVARYRIEIGERPGYLHLEGGDPTDPADNRLYVAPAITGNNTTIDREPASSAGFVRDLAGFPGGELPDHDLYRIDPLAAEPVQCIAKGVGSMLFDLDRNPATGALWTLSSLSENANPAKQTEGALNGDFVVNQLVVLPDGRRADGIVVAPPGIDIDDHDPDEEGPQYDAARSLNQARSIAFDPAGGAFLAGPFSEVIAWVDEDGLRVKDFQLPEGAQCFEVRRYDERHFVALCVGSATLEVFSFDPYVKTSVASIDLGHDPTPVAVRRGRDIFYDGTHSKDGRLSCASCHARGMSDHLGWSLKNPPGDVKDVMITQSLMSLADTYPHHWRGERDLVDFGKAFGGLLGATPEDALTFDQLEDMIVFMQSLQAPANPLQNPRRIVDDAVTPEPIEGLYGSAVRGQELFKVVEAADMRACSECHIFESGSNGNMFIEGDMFEGVTDLAPRTVNIENAHLRQLQNRGRASLWIDKNGSGDSGPDGSLEERDELTNVNGYGFSHSGTFATLFDFIADFPALKEQEVVDLTNFVEQWDQGISPAVHWAAFLSAESADEAAAEIEDILLEGARAGWNDVVAFGTHAGERARWLFDADVGRFRSDDPETESVGWDELLAATRAGDARHVVLGVPPGSGEWFALDHDNDGLLNGAEAALGSDPRLPDSDGDGWVDGHEEANAGDPLDPSVGAVDETPAEVLEASLDYVSARVAKYHARFSEDVTYVVEYGLPGQPTRRFERDDFSSVDTFVLTHDEPSTARKPGFDVEITLTDRAGNVTGPIPLERFEPLDTQVSKVYPVFVHVNEMEVLKAEPAGPDSLDIEVRIRIRTNVGAPNYVATIPQMVFSAISVTDPETGTFVKRDDFVTEHERRFDVYDYRTGEVFPFEAEPGGDYVLSPLTDAELGDTVIRFTQPNLVSGQTVRVSVMGSVQPSKGRPGTYDLESFGQMQPLKLEDSMEITVEFP